MTLHDRHDFEQYLIEVCTPRTYDYCVEYMRELGAKADLCFADIPSFYYDLLIQLNIMPPPTAREKRIAYEKQGKDIKKTKQLLIYAFIENHF